MLSNKVIPSEGYLSIVIVIDLWLVVEKNEHFRVLSNCYYYLLRPGITMLFANARRSNQSILKEISPGISLEGMTLKLKPFIRLGF